MATAPWMFRWLRFSLSSLLYVTTLMALFYALRRGYLMTAFDLDETIERARNVPLLLSLVAALLAAIFSPGSRTMRLSPMLRGATLGVTVSSLSCLALIVEFGEALRQMDSWNWWETWPLVAPYFIVAMVQGGAIGAFLLQLAELTRFLVMRRKAKTPSGPARRYNAAFTGGGSCSHQNYEGAMRQRQPRN